MIEYITSRAEKGRRYADIHRSSIDEGEYISIIIDNGEVERHFHKYLPSEGYDITIDLTPYCRAMATGDIAEVLDKRYTQSSYYDNHIACLIAIGYNDDMEEMRFAEPYGSWKQEGVGVLTKLPYLQVSRGEEGIDAIVFSAYTWDDDNMRISCGSAEVRLFGNGNNDTFLVQFTDYADKVTITTPLYDAELLRESIPVRVVPRGMNTRRLIWRNEMGGYDAWCFEHLRESSFATTSESFYSTTKGYTRTNRKSEMLHTVETRELDDITAEVVAYIIASPEVYLWDYATNTAERIDIVTEECRTYSDTELSGVQVSYRKRKRE